MEETRVPSLPGRSPGEGNSHAHQDSCLENPMGKEPGGLQGKGLWKSQAPQQQHTQFAITDFGDWNISMDSEEMTPGQDLFHITDVKYGKIRNSTYSLGCSLCCPPAPPPIPTHLLPPPPKAHLYNSCKTIVDANWEYACTLHVRENLILPTERRKEKCILFCW